MKKLFAKIAPVFGFLFIAAYIRSATLDVVYTDYIRLVNSYLENVFSIEPYLHGDILTRIPINYVERVINVVLFKYSTTFDMLMGAAGLSLSAYFILSYGVKKKLSLVSLIMLFFIMFSLDKWEMITNGTGWVHFWAFALFYYNYIVYDRVREGKGDGRDETRLRVLPFVIILLFSGPYCAIYFGAMVLIYLVDMVMKNGKEVTKKDWTVRLITLTIPFVLYLISRKLSVEEVAGTTSEPLMSVLISNPLYFVKFLVKSFASMVIGGETVSEYAIPGKAVFSLGLIVIAGYIWAVYINLKKGLYKETALPMLLIVSGLISHGIVLMARWGFLNDMYAMSSRYALQFQSGILGIVFTFAMKLTDTKPVRKAEKILAVLFIALLFFGRVITNKRELNMAQYRRAYFENMEEVALNADSYDDDTIKSVLQYSKPDKTRQALKILEEKKLNIFRQ